jgi:hypothetical protein
MTEPNPANPMSWLVILLLGFAFFFIAGVPISSERSASVQILPANPADSTVRPARPSVVAPPAVDGFPQRANAEYLGVEKVDVTIRESSPPQVSVNVSGYWSNGCSAEPQVDMALEGGNVTIAISRTIPPDVMCTMVLQAADLQIDITDLLVQNGVRSGQLTVTVNGVSVGLNF